MSDYSNEFFRKNLNYLIEKKGLTKKDLEKQLETGEGYLSRYIKEGCPHEPSVQVVKKLADILGVTIDQLIYQDIKKDPDILESRYIDEEESLFFEKLINKTRETKINWKEFRLSIDYDENHYDSLFKIEYDEDGMARNCNFKSLYENFFEDYYARKAYKTHISNDTEIIIVNYDYDNIQEQPTCIYEVYIVIQNKVYPACRYDENNIDKLKKLKSLWEAIEIDAPQHMVLKAYSDFLNNENEDEIL